MPLVVGAVVGGRYTLERELGRGATATVWLAHDVTSGRHVALKVLLPELAESSVRRDFVREISRTASLEHERILPVLGEGTLDDTLYLVQPFMAGGTLRTRLERDRQLPVAEVLRIGEALARALAHAHVRGFIHRDVKPENILFSEGEAHLGDFGICRALERTMDESSTTRLLVRGTPAYMSPEQASAVVEYDGRSDLFSLGAVLYECLAGVPAFIGSGPDAIIAQVMTQAPRDVRVFRPNVPESLAGILATCLEKRPADRFRDATSLAEALANSERRSGGSPRSVPAHRSRVPLMVGATVLLLSALAWLTLAPPAPPPPPLAPVDTTLLVLYPLERPVDAIMDAELDDDLLRDGFRLGSGIDLVDQIQVDDALRRRSDDTASDWPSEVARTLGAGRFVRGRLRNRSDGTWAYIALYDVQSTRALHETRMAVPRALDAAAEAYVRAAAELLVRGAAGLTDSAALSPGWSVPALQGYAAGQQALGDWDLVRADSAFVRSLAYDASEARTLLALAQVRAWMRRPSSTWKELAARAVAADVALRARERRLARALLALGERRYADACEEYDALRRQNGRDFAAWYGLGQCRSMDEVVVPDPTSPTGLRFRSSRHAASRAYAQAFKVLPTVHLGFAREGFDFKGMYFLVATDVRTGYSEDRKRRFLARPSWRGDTIAMIPFEMDVITAGGPDAVPVGFIEALDHQREAFRETAAGWSAAFPQSSEAKEAVALALELLGDRSAFDTLRVARNLAKPASLRRWNLGAAEVRLRVRFGLPDDLASLRAAHRLADSLIASRPANERESAETLELLAVLRGRCAAAMQFAAQRDASADESGLPPGPLSDSRQLLDRVAMRCDPPGDQRALREFTARLDAQSGTNVVAGGGYADMLLLMRQVLLASTRDSLLVERLAASVDHPLTRAARALVRGDRVLAIAALSDLDRTAQTAIPTTPDFGFIAAKLWSDAGDDQRATVMLDDLLGRIRTMDPNTFREPGSVAALLQVMRWRATLAAQVGDRTTERKWRAAVAALQDN